MAPRKQASTTSLLVYYHNYSVVTIEYYTNQSKFEIVSRNKRTPMTCLVLFSILTQIQSALESHCPLPNLISPIPDRRMKLHHKGHLPVQAGHGHAEPVQSGMVSNRT
jgi:hypothetical protein